MEVSLVSFCIREILGSNSGALLILVPAQVSVRSTVTCPSDGKGEDLNAALKPVCFNMSTVEYCTK